MGAKAQPVRWRSSSRSSGVHFGAGLYGRVSAQETTSVRGRAVGTYGQHGVPLAVEGNVTDAVQEAGTREARPGRRPGRRRSQPRQSWLGPAPGTRAAGAAGQVPPARPKERKARMPRTRKPGQKTNPRSSASARVAIAAKLGRRHGRRPPRGRRPSGGAPAGTYGRSHDARASAPHGFTPVRPQLHRLAMGQLSGAVSRGRSPGRRGL